MNDLAQALTDNPAVSATKMGAMLVAKGKLTAGDLNHISATQKKLGLRFGDAALKLGLLAPEDIHAILAEQFAYTQTPANSSKFDRRLSALFQPDSIQAEAVRSLRSELMLRYFNASQQTASYQHLALENMSSQRDARALALMSAEDDLGTALTAANLAISFAQLGMRTLLIDGNLRNPQLNSLFNLPPHALGLSDWIAERAIIAPSRIDTISSLSIMPAGTCAPNPQELLSSKQYPARLAALTQGFDITLITTSPMDSNRDALLIAAHAGAALLVARAHHTRTKALAVIAQRLRELGVRLLGATLRA